jgi:hypothetical protein
VVDRVAEQVDERVPDLVEHGPVELDVQPVHLEGDVLAQVARKVPDHAREPVEYVADRDHARLHDLVLELGGYAMKILE